MHISEVFLRHNPNFGFQIFEVSLIVLPFRLQPVILDINRSRAVQEKFRSGWP